MNILALDLSTKTGVAFGSSEGTPECWTVHLGKAPDARRFSNVLGLTRELIVEHTPQLIVVEAAIGGPNSSQLLVGLMACVEGCAWNHGVRIERAYLSKVRSHFLGKNLTKRNFPHLKPADAKAAIKAKVIQACALRGWSVESDDEADALATWDWACAEFAPGYQSVPNGGLFA